MIENGKFAAIKYTGFFDNKEVFDSNEDGDLLEFEIGSGMIIPGLDKAVADMNLDEEKEVRIEPAEAYGEYDDARVQPMPIDQVRQSFEPQEGMVIEVGMANGMTMPAQIKQVTDSEVFIDLNHPMAGKTLNFKVKVVDINDSPKYGSGCSSCGEGSCGEDGCCC